MMTIKEFATLCDCTTQTLRYYDKIDLLKPVKVDQWSGYRYYAKSQAIDFVKIKDLQAADFTIEEIKMLLTMPDSQVFEAFDRKIAEQAHKLERIKEIQQSYLTEVNTMKEMINSFCDQLLGRANDPEMLREFGTNTDDANKLVEAVRSLMLSRTAQSREDSCKVNVIVDDAVFEGPEAVEKMTFMIREEDMEDTVTLRADNVKREPFRPTEDMEIIWTVDGWSKVHEILDEIPALEDGKQYTLLLRIHNKPISDTLSYPLFMIGAMLLKGYDAATNMHCIIEHSTDDQNHFILMRRK